MSDQAVPQTLSHEVKKRKWPHFRADTTSAVASALAAIFSAYIAYRTYNYLPRQEDIAKQQLQATYLSNLYSKQVDNFNALQAAYDSVAETSFFADINKARVANQLASFDSITFKAQVLKDYEQIQIAAPRLILAAKQFALLVPKSFQSLVVLQIIIRLRQMANVQVNFRLVAPEIDKVTQFGNDGYAAWDALSNWIAAVNACAAPLFVQGKPLTDETIRSCKLPTS